MHFEFNQFKCNFQNAEVYKGCHIKAVVDLSCLAVKMNAMQSQL